MTHPIGRITLLSTHDRRGAPSTCPLYRIYIFFRWFADVRALPEKARREIGHQLALLQRGQQPTDWKPIPRVGPGTIEVRVHLETELRVLVVCKFEEAIYVLHAFIKRSRQTAERDIQLAADRYRALARERS